MFFRLLSLREHMFDFARKTLSHRTFFVRSIRECLKSRYRDWRRVRTSVESVASVIFGQRFKRVDNGYVTILRTAYTRNFAHRFAKSEKLPNVAIYGAALAESTLTYAAYRRLRSPPSHPSFLHPPPPSFSFSLVSPLVCRSPRALTSRLLFHSLEFAL